MKTPVIKTKISNELIGIVASPVDDVTFSGVAGVATFTFTVKPDSKSPEKSMSKPSTGCGFKL